MRSIGNNRRLPALGGCLATLGALVFGLPILAASEFETVTVNMTDGTQITAPYIRSTRTSVTVALNGVEKVIPMSEVSKLTFTPTPVANAVAVPVPAAVPNPVETPTETGPVPVPDPANAPADPATPAETDATTVAEPPVPAPLPPVAIPLPSIEAGKVETVELPLQWSNGTVAPWYAINRASSLHRMPAWTRADPAVEKVILADIDALGDLSKVPVARADLKKQISSAVPYLIIFLFDSSPARAEQCADLLIERGDRDVTKYFIEALYSLTDKNARPLDDWLQPYAAKLLAGANRFTGLSAKMDPAAAAFSADVFIAEWNENFAGYPAPYGEPTYKPVPPPANAAQQQEAWTAYFRKLDLKRVEFVRPAEQKVDLTRKYTHAADPATDAAIRQEIDGMGSGHTEKDRDRAKADFVAHDWSVIAPYIAETLIDKKDMTTRLTLLDVVVHHPDKALTWHILHVLIESWGSPTSVPSADSIAAIRVCDGLMRTLTGFTEQPAVQPTFVGGYKPVRGFINFWNHQYMDFPRQYGEPDLDKKLTKYNEYMKELRFVRENG